MTVRETGSGKLGHGGSSTDGVERVTSRLRHGRHDQRQATQRRNGSGTYGRKRPRRGTVTDGDDISNRPTSVRPTHSVAVSSTRERQHVSPFTDNSGRHSISSGTLTRTAARQLARPATPTHSPTTLLTTTGLLSFTQSAQLLELNSDYTVSRLHDRLTVY